MSTIQLTRRSWSRSRCGDDGSDLQFENQAVDEIRPSHTDAQLFETLATFWMEKMIVGINYGSIV